jgi:hypothetical protein
MLILGYRSPPAAHCPERSTSQGKERARTRLGDDIEDIRAGEKIPDDLVLVERVIVNAEFVEEALKICVVRPLRSPEPVIDVRDRLKAARITDRLHERTVILTLP